MLEKCAIQKPSWTKQETQAWENPLIADWPFKHVLSSFPSYLTGHFGKKAMFFFSLFDMIRHSLCKMFTKYVFKAFFRNPLGLRMFLTGNMNLKTRCLFDSFDCNWTTIKSLRILLAKSAQLHFTVHVF